MNKTNSPLPDRLNYLLDNNLHHLLQLGLKGLEKESLRITPQGAIAQTPHPKALGSALTHPHITTDYSEALLEFITPPFADIKQTLAYMHKIHQFVYPHLNDEMLLATSMPCGIDNDLSVPIAEYGTSNIGKMKHVYRKGLWHRYGRTMQAIAGIHFNYSAPQALWPMLYRHAGQSNTSLDTFIADGYFGLIRNFQRQGWLILYLFGASPAICKTFFNSRPHLMAEFEAFDAHTVYHPYATSLRMSDIGYKSKNQANLRIDYNGLDGYVASLGAAINTAYPDYQKIGVKVDGDYQQLNANILQIENEFYSTMRPKQIAYSGEKPTLALQRRGVLYVEMRSLDLNLFNPIGIDESTARFIEAFLLNCLLHDSPPQGSDEFDINNANQLTVANQGRKPGLVLNKQGQSIRLQDWAHQILDAMQPICALLDEGSLDKPYQLALQQQQALIDNPSLTPSARILACMRENGQEFGCFACNTSALHKHYFNNQPLDPHTRQQFDDMARVSLAKQAQLEATDTLTFDDFLTRYFSQS
ncbi:MAG: glutamate--cysteine ligase [Methylomonas sp.]|nr:glutamate--cysteine ligase [Methylomonas sp.]PPD20343.1 MAG: glutamate--cysteine ligase [Methylomonas sp.]PPD26612.1 MAG: glutamate--cysteine ligase [Methylomonas sp.]PPD38400.1 MAG: glutamate--cysteine ligase [Methylomonas sp.]PPD40444.1 MAG: glutamate--cysteine ligase [Methylomonas sp.]